MLIAITTALTLGLFLTTVGQRGRRTDDHPLCRRCRFDLTGRAPGWTRCPESGSGLDRPRAVLVGHRRRRRGWVVVRQPWSGYLSPTGVPASAGHGNANSRAPLKRARTVDMFDAWDGELVFQQQPVYRR